MKKIIVLIIALFAILPTTAFAQKGEKTVGLMGGYNTESGSVVGGLFFQYRFSKYFRLAPDFEYAFSNNGVSGFQINGNAHFPLRLDTRLNFYPLVGVTYQSWRYSYTEENGNKNAYSNKHFGANFGGGFEYMATPTLKLSIEGKYSWLKDNSNGGFTIGIGYLF